MVELRDIKYGLGTGTKAFNKQMMKYAFKNKVKLIDCATLYPTQRNIVGPTIKDLIASNEFDRDSVFIVSKLWVNELGKTRKFDYESWDSCIERNCRKALNELGVKQLDALLIHWPLNEEEKEGYSDEFIIEEIWPQMEQLVKKKMVKYIGVSNFGLVELHKLLDICSIKPYINELEINPYQTNKIVTRFCQDNNIRVIASSPFSFGWKDNHLKLFEEPALKEVANKHKISPAAVVVKWLMDEDIIPIPGTSKPEHWDEYSRLDSVVLEGDDILKIESLHKNLNLYANIYRKHNVDYLQPYTFNSYEALVGSSSDPELKPVRTDQTDFLKKCKESLTVGPGYLLLRKIFVNELNTINSNLNNAYNKDSHGRHDGTDPRNWKDAILNKHPIYSKLMNNNIIGLIVESLLGWDCLVDNCGFTTSRPPPYNKIFGPHQDSPFEQRPGAMLPHHESPVVIQALFCIDGFSEENGGLFGIPYTHKNRKRPNLPHHGNLKRGVIPPGAVAIDSEPGDVILALGNVWHGAYANKTDVERRAFLTEYVNSIIEPRDKFNASNISKDIYKGFSKRLVRLFSNRGKERLVQPWKEHQQKK